MKYQLLIFDWDGTLADSTGRIVDSIQRSARLVGLPAITDADAQNIIGLGLPEALRTLWPDIDADELNTMRETYARYFVHESQVSMELFAGARDMLERFLDDGYLLAVATGKSRKGLDRILYDLGAGHLFATTRCADETLSKPDPLMVNEILAELNVSASRALMIGDTTYDLDMAHAAGVETLAMSHGAHDDERLMRCQPLALCHDIDDLECWIRNNG